MAYTIINYLTYLLVPFFIPLIIWGIKNKEKLLKHKVFGIIYILFTLAFIIYPYVRVIEPNIIKVQATDIEIGFKGKFVLISDPHVGSFTGAGFMKRVVNKINEIEDVDAVIIAGDLAHEPLTDMVELLAPLKDLKYPAFAVLGNHDTGDPGPDIADEVENALVQNGVIFLDNTSVKLEDLNIEILGLGEYWDDNADITKLEDFNEEDNLVVIAHNPDTVYLYKDNIPDITLSGHTHGGQVRIPFLYKYMTKYLLHSEYDFDQGYYSTKKGKVYVSSGLGMSGLPFRLGIPPVIDILNLY